MENEHPKYFEPTHREEELNLDLNDSSNPDLPEPKDTESAENIDFPELSVDTISSEDLKNPTLDTTNACYTIESPIRLNTNEKKPSGFSSLKRETFDNNFKDLHKLKRKHELLALSKRYLYSKLYTPKLEALQRLVEPGKYLVQNTPENKQNSISSTTFRNPSINSSTRLDYANGESLTKPEDLDTSCTYDFKPDVGYIDTNRNFTSHLSSNFEFLDLDKIENEFGDFSFCDTDTSNKLGADSFKTESYGEGSETREDYKNVEKYEKLIYRYKSKLEESKAEAPSVVTLRSTAEYVNGRKKKRVQIPANAYTLPDSSDGKADKSHKIILKLVELDSGDPDQHSKNLLELIEDRLEWIAKSTELYGDNILNPERIIDQLESLKPPSMSRQHFLFLCMKPLGMSYAEYFKTFQENNFNDFLDKLYSFNLLNINAMGYVLDAEYEILKEFNRLGRIHQKLINEDLIYTKILSRMQDNFMAQAEDLLKTTRQDLRLEVGYSHLRWGRIKNVLTWKPGDPILREKGFAQDMASSTKMKTLQRMEQAFGHSSQSPYSPSKQLAANEAHYIYYIKTLQDLEEKEQEVSQLQVSRDRMQTLSEFSVFGPYLKPENSLPWKCIGLSCTSVVWKMYNTVECIPIVYKFRTLKDVGVDAAEKLEGYYNRALAKIRELNLNLPKRSQIFFSTSVQVHNKCVVEQMQFIKHVPFSILLEKSTQFNSAERYAQTQVVVREVVRMVSHLKGLKFILPLKSSRIYFNNGGVILSAGVPMSILGDEASKMLKRHSVKTIATLLWGKNIDWYLPPEANGNPSFTRDPLMVSKAHTWMIGKILYESICVSTINKNELNYSKIEVCEHEDIREFMKICLERDVNRRPPIEEILSLAYLKNVKLNYGTFVPMDVPKVRCAVEFLGDIETIVLNKMRKTEKGVADYEQYDYSEIKFCESNDENLGLLNNNDKYFYHRNVTNF